MSTNKRPKTPAPSKSDSNCHAGHRQRMRERYQQAGFSGFSMHEILEMLLYPAYTRINTNPIAHKLLDTFGSLENLFRHAAEDIPKSFPGQAYLAEIAITLLTEMQKILRPDPLTQGQIYVLTVFYLRRYPDKVLFLQCSEHGVLQDVQLLQPQKAAVMEQIRLCKQTKQRFHIAAVQSCFSLEQLCEARLVTKQLFWLADEWVMIRGCI